MSLLIVWGWYNTRFTSFGGILGFWVWVVFLVLLVLVDSRFVAFAGDFAWFCVIWLVLLQILGFSCFDCFGLLCLMWLLRSADLCVFVYFAGFWFCLYLCVLGCF